MTDRRRLYCTGCRTAITVPWNSVLENHCKVCGCSRFTSGHPWRLTEEDRDFLRTQRIKPDEDNKDDGDGA